jgi:hypothetical protein
MVQHQRQLTHSGRVRLWRPKRVCAPAAYQTKLQLTTLSLGDGWIGALQLSAARM